MSHQNTVSVETLGAIAHPFNAHDLDAIMAFFAEDGSLDMPRGPEPWGQRFVGKAAVREGLVTRFKDLPDVHYGDDRHWISGDMDVSEWLLTGSTLTPTYTRNSNEYRPRHVSGAGHGRRIWLWLSI